MGREQGFTRPKKPRTTGKAERVIWTIMEQWHEKTEFQSSVHRKNKLKKFVKWYNWVKPHKGIGDLTLGDKLSEFFTPRNCK